ncbi:MAG: archaeal heat shock protein Hsp14 [Haloferacaceae archaeon]
MTSQRNPFREIERMFEQMSEQFDQSSSRWKESPFGVESGESMSIDLEDREDEFVVTADLPGFDKDDIEVQLSDGTLEIHADHEEEHEEAEEGRYIRQERSRRSMSRSIRLPEAVDESEVTAKYKNGVLTVTLPKTTPSEGGKQVEIE